MDLATIRSLDDLRSGWRSLIEFGVANRTLFRLVSDPDRGMQSPAARLGRSVPGARVHRIAQAGRFRVSEQRAIDLIHAAGVGTIMALLSTPPEHRNSGLGEAMYEAVLTQIVADDPERPKEGQIPTVVAFRAIAPQLDVLSEAEQQLVTEWLNRGLASP